MHSAAFDACRDDLFSDYAELCRKYPKDTADKVIRVRDVYMDLLKSPAVADSVLVRNVVSRFKVSRPTAYGDIAVVKALLPMLSEEARHFHKWRAKEMLLETYRVAAAKMDVRTMERVASTYARTFEVSKDDAQAIPVEQILVQPFIPTDDPSVLGILPMKDRDNRIRQLLKEFRSVTPDIEEVDFEPADIDSFINSENDSSTESIL